MTSTGRLRWRKSSFSDVWQKLQSWAATELLGVSFFGIVEVAFYTRHPRSEIDGAIFSFHAHLVVWDVTREQIEGVAANINRRHRTLLPNLAAAHVRPMNEADGVAAAVVYAMKPPMQEYGAYLKRADVVDAVWQQQKRLLRPGHAAQVAMVFTGVEIDDLCLEGGAGSGLIATIGKSARIQIRRDERREERAFDRIRRGK